MSKKRPAFVELLSWAKSEVVNTRNLLGHAARFFDDYAPVEGDPFVCRGDVDDAISAAGERLQDVERLLESVIGSIEHKLRDEQS